MKKPAQSIWLAEYQVAAECIKPVVPRAIAAPGQTSERSVSWATNRQTRTINAARISYEAIAKVVRNSAWIPV